MHLPKEIPYCARTDYSIRGDKIFRRYEICVMNYAEDKERKSYGGDLCAFNDKISDTEKLNFAPCFLPTSFSGPSQVLAYDESEGYALIIGGQPTQETNDGITMDIVTYSGTKRNFD